MLIDKLYWGYGQKPKRLLGVSGITILLFGLLYASFPDSFKETIANKHFLMRLPTTGYYSIVTFTTLGYGDISPIGINRLFAAMEALIGAITLGFLVAGLSRND